MLNERQVKALEKVVLVQGQTGVHPNKDFIGKNAAVIARQIGVNAGDELRLLVADVDEKHPFVQLEMLMPVLPLVRVPDATEAIAMAKRVEHGFAPHGGDVLAQHRPPARDGAHDQHVDLREERLEPGRARATAARATRRSRSRRRRARG